MTSTMPCSPRMKQAVQAVKTLTAERGYPPTVLEVARRLGCSPVNAWRLLRAAVARGALLFDAKVQRSWRVAPRRARSA